jgi:TRAP-type uncharacterized transport system substrate-binding protein
VNPFPLIISNKWYALDHKIRSSLEVAYNIANVIYLKRDAIKWFVHSYSNDSKIVKKNDDAPLNSGPAKYYHEMGYMLKNLFYSLVQRVRICFVHL